MRTDTIYHVNYWLKKGYSETDSLDMVEKSKTERDEINKTRGLTKKQLYEKFGEEKTQLILKNRGKGVRSPYEKRFSKISIELFNILNEMNKDKVFIYGKDEKFICVSGLINRKGYFVDFYFENDKKIIEFNGDFWHFNPKKYVGESFCILNGIKVVAEDVWKQDKNKIKSLRKNGYKILTIWENDYVQSKEKIIKKCDRFLKKM